MEDVQQHRLAKDTVDPADIFSTSMMFLYSMPSVTHSEAGSLFDYTPKPVSIKAPNPSASRIVEVPIPRITVKTPDTQASNWSLHASSIWTPALYLVDHISELGIGDTAFTGSAAELNGSFNVLELGAGAGLPGIAVAKLLSAIYGDKKSGYTSEVLRAGCDANGKRLKWHVTLSDYPDDVLISTLEKNVQRNDLPADNCRVVPFMWGAGDVSVFLGTPSPISSEAHRRSLPSSHGFDVIFAADTLWNSSLHLPFYDTLLSTLRPDSVTARIHLVAGLHTGRYTIASFLNLIHARENDAHALVLQKMEEREIDGDEVRPWVVDRNDEDDGERRRWLVWMVLKWNLTS